MRAIEFLRESQGLAEIERLPPGGFEGGKEHLEREYDAGKTIKKLPGGSGLLYSIQHDGGDFKIRLWDPANKGEFEPVKSMHTTKPSYYSNREWKELLAHYEKRNAEMQAKFARSPGKLIGELQVSKPYNFPLKNALQVGVITVDEDYRGMGLAKALYGIVLTIMKRPLVAGSSQTPGGRRNWLSLSQIPGVQMKGYFGIDELDLRTVDVNKIDKRWEDPSYIKYRNKQAEKTIDTIMGQLGGQYIGKSGHEVFFAFDVQPDTTKQELKAYVDSRLTKVYGRYDSSSGLYAVWTGR
jgi:ribosomal protein S18 acetylase RimI-like enzyme